MSRAQVSIDRLPPRRLGNEPRESMNCKSCRKRKIKCNRMRPTCEACSAFQCPCIYDAIPKKRGPKTDVLEALLKRVDGLEKRLQDEKNGASPTEETSPIQKTAVSNPTRSKNGTGARRPTVDTTSPIYPQTDKQMTPHSTSSQGDEQYRPTPESFRDQSLAPPPPLHQQPFILPDVMLDAFFSRLHGKPFYILDESMTRQRHQLGQLPPFLAMAIYTITLRYTNFPRGSEASLRLSHEYSLQARRLIDIDNPSIESLQALLLLSLTFFANGQGKKAYMTLTNCVGMAIALDLYRETSPKAKLLSSERETRRRLFWACYMMDRFMSCGSKRPSLIADQSINLRLPSWSANNNSLPVEGEVFNAGPNTQFSSDSRKKGQGASSLLVDITRILGVTNRYLAAGGVRGDSHFPWHSLSNLSKIRQELDIWAAGTQDMFVSIDALFGHSESTTLLLSKLIYHLVHCLIYRPFLPMDLVELRGTGQHQSWQIEATNLCFSHSNAIAELVELGKNSPLVEWPSFVGYCVCTAATVHIHGVHYKGKEGEVFASSAEFLAREMHQLSWLRKLWVGVQHSWEMLQNIYNCHSELVRTLASSPMRFSPVFHLEDFFDRYTGQTVDSSHVRLVDVAPELMKESSSSHNRERHQPQYNNRVMAAPPLPSQQRTFPTQPQMQPSAILPSTPTSQGPPRRGSQQIGIHPEPQPVSPTINFGIPPQPTPYQQAAQLPFSPSAEMPPFTVFPGGNGVQNPFSPSAFPLSPSSFPTDGYFNVAPTPPPNPQYATFPFEPQNQSNPSHPSGMPSGTTALTPGAQSQASGSHTTASDTAAVSSEKDPFLSLLEQLAENEQNSQGGPSELDFFLAAGAGEGDEEGMVGMVDGDHGRVGDPGPSNDMTHGVV